MSTFGGIIKEIKGISVDRFDGENLNSTIYFLSHCHSDHMRGLYKHSFHDKLVKENQYLYLSSVSAIILRALIPRLYSRIKELPLEEATSISAGDKHVSVTCIPAGHCPGSIMFLFETENASVLYTGDYRINQSDFKKFKCFYDSFGNVKKIDKIYLDTTFFLESYYTLPKRQDSLSELCKIISSWISQSKENCIKLDVRARYGYEFVFKELYEVFKMPVHVDIDKYHFYSVIPELDKCVTTNGSITQIHSCHYDAREICDFCDSDKLRTIRLSAMRWEYDDFKKGITEMGENQMFYVCYSTHASYEEGVGLLEFLKPQDVHICVERPDEPVADEKIKKLVEKQLKKINGNCETLDKYSPKLFSVPRTAAKTNRGDLTVDTPPKKISKVNCILDSPPR